MRNTCVVAYDISNDGRLRRVHKTMVGFGDRPQYSVFECFLGIFRVCRHPQGQTVYVILNRADERIQCVSVAGLRAVGEIGQR